EQRWRILSRVALATQNQPVFVRKTLELVYTTDEAPELEPACEEASPRAPPLFAAAARWRNAVVVPPAPSSATRRSAPQSRPPSPAPSIAAPTPPSPRPSAVVPPAPFSAPRPSAPPSPSPAIKPTDRAEKLLDAMEALEQGWS